MLAEYLCATKKFLDELYRTNSICHLGIIKYLSEVVANALCLK